MKMHVFKRKRKVNGKTIASKNYSGRYRLDGDFASTTISLNTNDKQVAQKKLQEIVYEKERELAGLIAPKLERVSAERPLCEHLSDFKADLRAKGRTEKYIRLLNSRVERLTKSCGWKYTKDISIDRFVGWRSHHQAAPKTLNEYLNAMNALLNWMARQGRVADNPLRNVEHVDLRGRQQLRRAYTDDELTRLLEVAGDYQLLYLAAAYTGLRLSELTNLLWLDVHLDTDRPHLQVRASTTKNSRRAIVPLHSCLIEEFQRARDAMENDFVFPQYAHPDRRLARHFTEAGLARIDAAGRKLDFHSFRYTFATKLAKKGISQRLAQELMRHSDPRLTANLYTDVAHLPTFDAVQQLDWHK